MSSPTIIWNDYAKKDLADIIVQVTQLQGIRTARIVAKMITDSIDMLILNPQLGTPIVTHECNDREFRVIHSKKKQDLLRNL